MRHTGWTTVAATALLAAAGCAAGSPSSTSSRPYAAHTPSAADRPTLRPTALPSVRSPRPLVRAAKPPPPPAVRATPARPAPSRPAPSRPATTRYVFPIAGCAASYGRSHHDYPATDIFAAAGCSVVSPVAGRVDEVSYVDRWNPSTNLGADRGGISVSVVGVDGVRYYGSHLSSVAAGVRPGLSVAAGRLLGRVGNTGSARGQAAHLHFGISWPTPAGIWWVRRGEIYPWPYLDSWRAGGSSSPASAVFALRARLGVVPPCTSYC
jgi:murein DD-endopeptidase MepM/ murein hydrolase activator NlpD